MLDPRDVSPDQLFAQGQALDFSPDQLRRYTRVAFGTETRRTARELQKRLHQWVDQLPRLLLQDHQRSEVDGFEKLLFQTADNLNLETVLIPLHKPGSVSLCLSSQIGCAMGCQFCATARMSSRRNLRTWEILDQWIQARRIVESQGRRVTSSVFMGMGEPFLNYEAVLRAAELLRCPHAGSLSGQSITLSTVGIVPQIDRYTREGHRYRLSVSLGGSDDSTRGMLVPVAARWPIAEVMDSVRRHARQQRQRALLAYVCISGLNVAPKDAANLARLIGSTPVRLNLIDVTDPTGRFQPPDRAEMDRFRDALTRELGQPVVRRYSGGAEIDAACGTLAGR